MAHYAFLDANNVVTEVIVGKNENEDGIDWEEFYGKIKNQKCKRTSYNTVLNQHKNGGIPYRGNYAGIGYTYDETMDVFIPPKPFPSWLLNAEKVGWEAPVPFPEDASPEKVYLWDEDNRAWVYSEELSIKTGS